MDAITLISNGQRLPLSGPGALRPVIAARPIQADARPEGRRDESALALELTLSGLPIELTGALERIERLLWRAASGSEVTVERVEYPDGPAYAARLTGGRLVAGSVAGGAILARLELAHRMPWYAQPAEAPLNSVSGGILVSAPGYLRIDALEDPSSFPAALTVEVAPQEGGCGRVRVGLAQVNAGADSGLLGAKTARGGAPVAHAGSFGGEFRRCGLPAQEGALLAWDLPAGLAESLAGRETALALRFSNPVPGGAWLAWEVCDGAGALLAGSGRALLPAGVQLADLPALPMPDASIPLSMRLVGQAAGGGALDVNYAVLLPAGPARWFPALPAGSLLRDDGVSGLASLTGPDGRAPCPASGAPLCLDRALPHRLHLLTDAGATQLLRVRAWAHTGCGR